MLRHPDLTWERVETCLQGNKPAVEILIRMEKSGGEPDTIGLDTQTGKLIFCGKPLPGAEACATTRQPCKNALKIRLPEAPLDKPKKWV